MDESERSFLLVIAVILTAVFPLHVALLFLPQVKNNRILRKIMILLLLPIPPLVIGLFTMAYPSTFYFGVAFLSLTGILVFVKRRLIRQTIQRARNEMQKTERQDLRHS